MRSSAARGLPLLAALAIGSCGQPAPGPPDAGADAALDAALGESAARFAHLAWDAPAVSVWVDGARVVESLEVFGVAPSDGYLALPSGAHAIALAPVGEGVEGALFVETLELAPGAPHTVFSFGTLAALDGSTGLGLSDDTPPPPGRLRGRFVHAATGVGAVDVTVRTMAGSDQARDLAPGEASALLLDGSPDLGAPEDVWVSLAAAGGDPATTGARVRARFAPFTIVAIVGDARAPSQYELVTLTADGPLRQPLSSSVCVAHASSASTAHVRSCQGPLGCYGALDLEPRRVGCVRGGDRIEVTANGATVPLALEATHFREGALVVLHDRAGEPALAGYSLAPEATRPGLTARLIHLADGVGPLRFTERVRATALGVLGLGEATERVPVPEGGGGIVDAEVGGARAQWLPLRAAAPELDVLAFTEDGALRLARLPRDGDGPMLVAGALPIGAACGVEACAPEALCVRVEGEATATCRRADCPANACGADEACGAVVTDAVVVPEEAVHQAPTCLPGLTVSADVDTVLAAEPPAEAEGGAFDLWVGGEHRVLDRVHATVTRLLRRWSVIVGAVDAPRAAGGAGWSVTLDLGEAPASGPATLRVGYGEGPAGRYDAEVYTADVEVAVRVAPAALDDGEPLSLSFGPHAGVARGTLGE